ncbi:MAG: glycosyl transferase family 2 [Clostridiales bacterium]|nr:glycosyl transferase family 2 [Clostridiales bacterium]
MDLSVIIVSYNNKKLLKQTIDSIYDTRQNINFEIIVVDNKSTDGSVELIKQNYNQVKLIENKNNLGFSKANNIGIKQSKGRYILLLNSDTIVTDNCFEKCIKYMKQHPDIGALGCKVVLPDGKLDPACKRSFPTPEVSFYRMTGLSKLFPKSKRFGKYNLTYLDEDEIHEVDCLVGAFMMVKRETIEQVGLLDEDFFMYGEDIDWCYRIKNAGWKIVYYPEAQIIHYKGGSSDKKNPKLIYEFYRSMYLFYNKHYKDKYSFLTTLLVYSGIGTILALKLVLNAFKR